MFKYNKILILCIIVMNIFVTKSYAQSVEVTSDLVQSTISKIFDSKVINMNFKIMSKDNPLINFGIDGEYYHFRYDLDDKPTFTFEAEISQGMSYQDFKEETNYKDVFMLAYIAVANIQGMDLNNARDYYLASLQNNNSIPKSEYIIVDTEEKNNNIQNTDTTPIIYISEFENKVLDYTDSLYDDEHIIADEMYIITIKKDKEIIEVPNMNYKSITYNIKYEMKINTESIYTSLNQSQSKIANNTENTVNSNNIVDNENIFLNNVQNKNIINSKENNLSKINFYFIVAAVVIIVLILVIVMFVLKRRRQKHKKSK